MAIVHENDCVGCEHCINCGNDDVIYLYCDKCDEAVDTLYNYNGEQWCSDCILKDCGEVDFDE